MTRTSRLFVVVIALTPSTLLACADTFEPDLSDGHDHAAHEGFVVDDEADEEAVLGGGGGNALKGLSPNARVEDAVYGSCTTASIRALSDQLLGEVNCLRPGTLERIDGIPNVRLTSAALPWLQAPAAKALRSAAARRSMTINSATRTLPQQYLLYRWYQAGSCGISLAAPPGGSNHESGLAIDVDNYDSAHGALSGQGFVWLGGGDPVHFDWSGAGGADLRALSVLAFQRLWNRNNPGDRIAEDGAWGEGTASRLARAPIGGFARGASCGEESGRPEREALDPIEVYWSRQPDGAYNLGALAWSNVQRVEYYVDGYHIGGAARRAGESFKDRHTFTREGEARHLEVLGFDAADELVALGDGLLDVRAGTGVYVKQLGQGLYEIGLERAPAEVAAIEVRADGWLLTDATSGLSRSPRRAVRTTFNQGGLRRFELRTFNADGTLRGTLRREFSVTAVR